MFRAYYRTAILKVSRNKLRLIVLWFLLTCIISVAVLFNQSTHNELLPIPTIKPSLHFTITAPVDFKDVTLKWNAAVTHQQLSTHLTTITESLGSGVCAIDVNNDGWIDLFFVGGQGHTRPYGKTSWWSKNTGNRLLINKEGHHFEDVTFKAGLSNHIWGMSCAVGDLNNDGLSDLIITGVGLNLVYKNNGNTTFSNVTPDSGIVDDNWSTGASLADFNGDGLLDFYLSNYVKFEKGARTFERDSGFKGTTNIAFDHTLYDPEPNRLYLNKGNFLFEDVGKEMGVENSLGRSLGAKWHDLNKDDWLDLLVVNDHGSPNQVYINNKGVGFIRGAEAESALEVAGSHDVVINDFDNDSFSEFYMTRRSGHSSVFLSPNFHGLASTNAQQPPDKTNPRSYSYMDISWSNGLANTHLIPFSGWGATAADFNNDGFLDLYMANGMIHPDLDSKFVAQAQENRLFINNQDGGFELQRPLANREYPSSSRGVISVDLDNDGYLEVVVSNNNGALQILENEKRVNNWIALDFRGNLKDSDVYGSKVILSTDSKKIFRTLNPQQQFLSQGDKRLHIGVGQDEEVERIKIQWRDGTETVFNSVDINRYYAVDKDSELLKAIDYRAKDYQHIKIELGLLDEEELIKLSRLLIGVVSPIYNNDDITHIWSIGSTNVRLSMLEQIVAHSGQNASTNDPLSYLTIIKQALVDESSQVKLKAIEILRKREMEVSVNWLIPLLTDTNFQVQCAVADAFSYFFNEEEAVIHKKNLAIPPLIKLLESKNVEAVICAADALAVAESRRAVIPLMELLKETGESRVQVAISRALGLIGDAGSTSLISQMVQNSALTGEVVGAGLVALRRLNGLAAEYAFDTFFVGSYEDSSLRRRYDALAYLFSDIDGVIFPKAKLERVLSEVISSSKLKGSGNKKYKVIVDLAKLKAIAASKSSRYEIEVLSLVKSTNQVVKKQALITLALLGSKSSRQKFEMYMHQEEASIVEKLLKEISVSENGLSDGLIEALSKDNSRVKLALEVMNDLPFKPASKLLSILLTKEVNEEHLYLLLNACVDFGLSPDISGTLLESTVPETLRPLAIDCFLQTELKQNEEYGLIDKFEFKTFSMIKEVLSDKSIDVNTRTKLLVKASKQNKLIARELMLKKLRSLPQRWLLPALEVLSGAGEELRYQVEFLWSLYKNSQLNWDLRLQAAELLIQLNRDSSSQPKSTKNIQLEVINYLYQSIALESKAAVQN